MQFYHYCFDAALALAVALKRTTEGIILYAVQIGVLLIHLLPLELGTDEVNTKAREQAGLQGDMDFQITDFNYNVSIVTNLIKMHLEPSCIEGLSVY